ncbi:MAG: Cro/Cl family transcriptional regulator [Bacteroidetes bacterium]|jgi:uncharacterized protein YjbI with pentapeptide repeats|nr:Cro/Cl family transcriptional regulator [Bacteroidota bacterium]
MESNIIGDKIARARKKMSLSQAELAEQLFISPQAVGKWERGESIPDIVTINKLAKILGVDLNYFSEDPQSTDEETTPKKTNDGGDTEQRVKEEANLSGSKRELLTNFSGSDLAGTDFAGVTAHKSKFNGSALRGADFSGANLSGSSFMGSDVSEANFNGTNLTDCTLSAINLTDASFNKTILVRTEFSSSELTRTKFIDAKLIDVKLSTIDLRKTIFENCSFNGVDFKSSDLSGVCLDGQTFTDVKFDNTAMKDTTFKDATLQNVSFRPTFALTNKYYRAIKTICFDGATMDKLTYAALKGIGANLSKVTTK